jgi:hypothetical protein
MKRTFGLPTIAIGTALALGIITSAAADCESARDQYNSAIEQIASYMRRYAQCVTGSQGSDDCSSEFRRLRNAHDDFETAVSEIGSECH